ASLIFGNEQHYFRPTPGPGSELHFDLHRVPVGAWFRQSMSSWEFGAEELSKAIRQLNLGQSAQIENRRGEFLRLWINPKERSKGIERLGGPKPDSAPEGRNLAKVAESQINILFAERIGAKEKQELIAALVQQWEKYDGRAL